MATLPNAFGVHAILKNLASRPNGSGSRPKVVCHPAYQVKHRFAPVHVLTMCRPVGDLVSVVTAASAVSTAAAGISEL